MPVDVRLWNAARPHSARLPKTPLPNSLLAFYSPVLLLLSPSLLRAFVGSSSGVFLPSCDGTPLDRRCMERVQ